MTYDSKKQTGSFLLRLALIIAMASIQSPGLLRAEERSAFSSDIVEAAGESPTSLPVQMADEFYGASRLARAAERYYPATADSNCVGEVSFIVAGEVRSPGEYSLPAPINLLSALLAAGGPTPAGSMRQVQVYHDGSLLGEFDLYGFFNEGRIVDDFIFNGGEHVVVMPHGARVSVSGSVAAPAVFELKPDELNLQQLFELCGGFAGKYEAYRIEVIRVAESRRNIAFSADVSAEARVPDFKLIDGDRVSVYENTGSRPGLAFVQFPDGSSRKVVLHKIMRLSHLLDDLQPLPDNISKSYAEILRVGRPDKKYEVIGISIEGLSKMIAAGDSSHDLVIRPGDRLVLFDRDFIEKKPVVGLEIRGQSPMFTDYRPGMKISDLLKTIEVELPGKQSRAKINRRRLSGARLESMGLQVNLSAARRGSKRHDVELQPFDVLVIQP